MTEVAKQSVLITGATDGLGYALALLLAKRGYRVFAAGRSPERLAKIAAIARENRFAMEGVPLDVCSDESVTRAVNNTLSNCGGLDVLVNNAGVNYTAAVEDLSMEDWRAQFETNVFGLLRVTRAVLPHMREQRRGRILMMSSVSGLVTAPTQGAYSASKHAVEAISNALRLELYPFGIDVVLIEPGYIVTGIQKTAAEFSRPYVEKNGPYSPLYARFLANVNASRAKSESTPEDCARVMLHAIEARSPKPRYGVTRLARTVKWSRWLLTDKAFDAMLRRRYGIAREMM